jgi:hypothetical protein
MSNTKRIRMNWIRFKDELPELAGKILVRETISWGGVDHFYYLLLQAEPLDIYSKMIWVKQLSNSGRTSPYVVDLLTNEYMSSEYKEFSWIRLPWMKE